MMLQFEGMVATGSVALDSGISDTALKTFNGDTFLYSVTGPGGGITVWKLLEGIVPQQQDIQYYSGTISQQIGNSAELVTLAGSDQLILDVDLATGLVGYTLNPDGTVGTLQTTDSLIGGGDVSALVQYSVETGGVLALAHEDTGQISTYLVNPDGSLTVSGSVAGRADSMEVIQFGSENVVVASDAETDSIAIYTVESATGGLSEVDNSDALNQLGIAVPTAVDVVQAYGQSWVVVAGAQSNSISLMKLDASGSLVPTDHVLDSLHTRFETLQDMSIIEVDGHVFLVAGGGDDGVTLFTMTPGGQLVYLDSFADTLDTGLQNVETVITAHVGDELQIFASSQQDGGLTQLTVDLSDLGIVQEGFGTITGTNQNDMLNGGILDTNLSGGAGDDILIAGAGATEMTGGAGADIFVMQHGSAPVIITDFEAGTDRLDMFDFPLLRTPDQLTFTATGQGAWIEFLDTTVELISAAGGPLSEQQVFGAGFGGPDHIPVDLGTLGGLDPGSSDGVLGDISIDSQTQNPALANAEIQLALEGGGILTVRADENGVFDFDLPPGMFSGEFDVIKGYSTASADINALDALQVLRISVGLEPTWGPASAENLIAADITQDGTVNALDALAILQVSVGQSTPHSPEWVFLDDDADLSGITPNNVSYETGVDIVAVDNVITADMTTILLGNIEQA
ncbi:dockerin type I domain-containing protein [Ruegeria lacuscaerulensis]|uniref:dockerin type I domain-containing protein n=1 Tax=Ruegeria lacuscaerulensis TaxID=55218 RepID=UPI00147DA1F9|nr:dockerin type I domain-containing protein [Ruegeria lacuscaerulensis]